VTSGSHKVPSAWRKLFALIPGYDPIAGAGDCRFDAKTADKVVDFFPTFLTHIEGANAGKPFTLEPWQAAIVGCAFGWLRPDGLRRYREVFQYIPRKNGKSTLLGGLINLVAFCDNEPGAQIYSAAAEREQAALVYRQTKGMILQNPDLASQCKIYVTAKSIEYPGNVVFKALSADADTKHGFNTHFVVVDELHAQPNRDLVDVLVTSTGSRRQPLVWYITTADFARESICNEKHQYASRVRDNGGDPAKPGYDPAFLPVIFEAKPDDDWKSPAVWRKANPNLGVSVSEDYIARECQRAEETPAYENTFKRLHLNMRTQTDVRWLKMDKWNAPQACAAIDIESLVGRECYGGLDLSTTHDITAFAMVFPPIEENEMWKAVVRSWIPEENAHKRERRDKVPYVTWARQGFVTMTEGPVINYATVKEAILEDCKRFRVNQIAFDPYNATQIVSELGGEGVTMVELRQGMLSMSGPSKELEKLVISGKLQHGGNPALTWMAGNAVVEEDAAGNIKPNKRKSTERIDGIVALVMAIGRAIVNQGPVGSVYESRELITL